MGIVWGNTTPSTELPRDFCAGIGPPQLGVVLVFFYFTFVCMCVCVCAHSREQNFRHRKLEFQHSGLHIIHQNNCSQFLKIWQFYSFCLHTHEHISFCGVTHFADRTSRILCFRSRVQNLKLYHTYVQHRTDISIASHIYFIVF